VSIAAEPLHRLVRTTFEHAGTTQEEARLVRYRSWVGRKAVSALGSQLWSARSSAAPWR
jgi:hypothetical protein